MSGGWQDLGPGGEATAEAAFVALQSAAELSRAGASVPRPALSPSALWAHATGLRAIPAAELAAALLATPGLRATLAGLLERAAVAVGPRVAAAASERHVAERGGDGFRLRLLRARGGDGQTWVVIDLERRDAAPARLTVLPPEGGPVCVSLSPPQDGQVQLLSEASSDLVRALADPASVLFLH